MHIRDVIFTEIREYIKTYRVAHGFKVTDWRTPIVGYSDARSDYILNLRNVISPTHFMPSDMLDDATVIISYFLPFCRDIGESNVAGDLPSSVWVDAYNHTNNMFLELNEYMVTVVNKLGCKAVSPENYGKIGTIDVTHVYSNWSQRHIAYSAGLGTFGINNMLITYSGTCGRFYSLVTNLPITPDRPKEQEACLYKRLGTCQLCIKQCPIGALTPLTQEQGYVRFDRERCSARLHVFESKFGVNVCGKCVVGLPCTFKRPSPADLQD